MSLSVWLYPRLTAGQITGWTKAASIAKIRPFVSMRCRWISPTLSPAPWGQANDFECEAVRYPIDVKSCSALQLAIEKGQPLQVGC